MLYVTHSKAFDVKEVFEVMSGWSAFPFAFHCPDLIISYTAGLPVVLLVTTLAFIWFQIVVPTEQAGGRPKVRDGSGRRDPRA